MAQSNSPYDREADQERSPTTDNGIGGNQTAPGRSSYNLGSPGNSTDGMNSSSNPYAQSAGGEPVDRDGLRDAEENGNSYPYRNSTAGGDNNGGSSSTTGPRGPDSRFGNAADEDSESDSDFSFNPKDKSQRGNTRMVLRAANKHRKVMLVGTGLTTGVVGLLVSIFLVLIPLKIEHIITNLQDRFFATSENAVDNQTDNMLSDYVKRYVIPALSKCKGTSIDKSCNPSFGTTTNPVDSLYKGWSQARLENKLATNYGIEFRYNSFNHKYYMKVPGVTSSSGDDITNFVDPHDSANFNENLFQQVSRGQVRQAVDDAVQNETQLKQVFYRYKVGRLLEAKYGINRCLIYCGTRDALADKVADQKVAAKLYLVQNVLTPRTQVIGIVMECLISTTCNPEKDEPTVAQDTTSTTSSLGSSTTTPDGTATIITDGEEAGAPKDPEFDANVLTNFAASRGSTATEEQLVDAYKNLSENGYQKVVLEEILGKVGLGDLAGQAIDNASIIQWVNTASNITVDAKKAGPSITKLSYVTNSSADVKLFSMYRTYADEIHTGHVNATEVGSMVDSLGPVASSSTTKDLVGGTASAEETPLYNNLITKSSSATGTKNYTCGDGKQPGSNLICPEEKLGGSNAASGISAALSNPPLSYISDIAGVWHSTVGGIFNFVGNIFGDILSSIPGVNSVITDATTFVSKAAQPFFDFLTNKLIPNPFSENMSGGRTFDLVAEGADVAGNDVAHEQLGGKVVSATTAAGIADAQQTEAKQDFSHESFFARMFSTDSPYSLVSTIAMDTPIDLQASAETGFADIISNPFGTISSSFASIFSGKASASDISGVVDGKDFANIPQYDPVAVAHAVDYWNANCTDNPSQAYETTNRWNEAAANNIDSETGEPENTTSNPCLTIKSVVCSAGATSDSSLCTPDDLADANNPSGSPSPSGSPDCTTATGNAKILCEAEQYKGIYYLGGGGHNYSAFEQACSSSVLASAASTSTAANPGPCATDCSGLVSVAASQAFGQNFSWDVAGIENDTQDWQKVDINSVQPGDVVTVDPNVHVEIVDHYDASSGQLYTFGSHQTGQQTSQRTSAPSDWSGAYRYIGPGSG